MPFNSGLASNKEPRIKSNEEEKEEKNLGWAVDARPSTARPGFDSQEVLKVNPSEAELARGWGPGSAGMWKKGAVIPRRARIKGAQTFVPFNSRLESHKEEKEEQNLGRAVDDFYRKPMSTLRIVLTASGKELGGGDLCRAVDAASRGQGLLLRVSAHILPHLPHGLRRGG